MRRLTAFGIAAAMAGIAAVPACSRKTVAAQTSGTSAPLQAPRAAPPKTAAAAAGPVDLQPPTSASIQKAADNYKALADSMPAALTDVDALASTLRTPQADFAFVRDQLALEPYGGVEKGARGTLLTRGGNDLDRALLLAGLLKSQGVDAKLAHGTLRPDQAQQLLGDIANDQDAFHREAVAVSAAVDKSTAAASPGSDPALEAKLANRVSTIQQTIDREYGWLTSQVKSSVSHAGDTAPALAALQNHYWVTATMDGKETALDPSFKAAQIGQTFASAVDTFDPDNVPDSAQSTLTFRLVAEYLESGKLTSDERLHATTKSADLLGKPIRFVLMPRGAAAKATSFRPTLVIGDDTTSGDPVELHRGGDSGGSAGPLGGFGGGFGGALGGGGASSAPAGGAPLARVSLELTWHVPGRSDQRYRRIIVDRVASNGTALLPAFADDGSIRLPLMQAWDGMVSAGPYILPFQMHAEAEAFAADASAAQTFEAAAAAHKKIDPAQLPHRVLPITLLRVLQASDYERVILARQLNAPCRFFYEGVRLAFLRHGFEPVDLTGASPKSAYREGIDLVNSPFGFVCKAGGSAAALALKAGVADTVLEMDARPRVASLNTIPLLAQARSGGTFAATSLSSVPASIAGAAPLAAVLRDAFARGDLIVGPSSLIAHGAGQTFAWWEIGPNGCSIGRANLGGGQAMTEDLLTDEQQEEVTKIVTDLMGNFLNCMFSAVSNTLAAGKWVAEENTEKANEDLKDNLAERPAKCMIHAVCDALLDISFDFAFDGLLEAAAEDEVKALDGLLFKLGQRKGALIWLDAGGCAGMIEAAGGN